MNSMKSKIAVAMTAILTISSVPAMAQGVPVVDPGAITQTVKVVQNGVQQVQEMKRQVEQMTSMAKTIGQTGPLEIAKDLLAQSGLNFDGENSQIAPYRAAMPGLLDALPSADIGKSIGIPTDLAQKAKTNLTSGREFALQAFYKPGNAKTEEIQQRQGIREAAMRDSVTAGYAMAVYTKNDLGKTEDRMKTLSEGVSKAADLRADVQSNSAIALAQLQQLTIQNTLLAQILEVQSTAAMASTATGVK